MRVLIITSDDRTATVLESWLSRDFLGQIVRVQNALNRDSQSVIASAGRPLLIVRAESGRIQIAHWSLEKAQTCPICLDLRINSLRELRRNRSEARESFGNLLTPFIRYLISSILTALMDMHNRSIGYDIDASTLRWTTFSVLRHSDCPTCTTSIPDDADSAVVELTSQRKPTPRQYRIKEPVNFRQSFRECLNPTTGAFGVGPVWNYLDEFQVVVTPLESLSASGWRGIGNCYRESLAIGLCEALERHAALSARAKVALPVETLAHLGARALDPRECGCYEPEIYKANSSLSCFTENLKVRWTWAYSLTQQRSVLVPSQLVYYGSHLDNEARFVRDNSSGCASGSCIEEAILFALFELIERDSFILHWIAQISSPQIDPETIENHNVRFLIERARRAELEVHFIDGRLDIAIPVVIAVVLRKDRGLGALTVGTACRFDPGSALEAALSEALALQSGFQTTVRRREQELRAALSDLTLVRSIRDHGLLYGLPEAANHARFLTSAQEVQTYEETFAAWEASVPKTLIYSTTFTTVSNSSRLPAYNRCLSQIRRHLKKLKSD